MPLALLLLALLIGLPACQSSADSAEPADTTSRTAPALGAADSDSLHVTRIRRMEAYTWPEGGNYYVRRGEEDPTMHTGDREAPTDLLQELRRAGVPVTHAWHRPGASSCSPPDSPMAMDVIVPEQLLVRLTAPWPDASAQGFSPVEAPHVQCPYEVTLYEWR